MFCSVEYAPQWIKGKREYAFFLRGGGEGGGLSSGTLPRLQTFSI